MNLLVSSRNYARCTTVAIAHIIIYFTDHRQLQYEQRTSIKYLTHIFHSNLLLILLI